MLLLIYGDDGVRVAAKTEELRKRFVDKFDASRMNLAEFFASGNNPCSLGDVRQAMQSVPFLAERRMVIVHDLFGALKKAETAAWATALHAVPPSTIMVLVAVMDAKAAEKHPLFAAVQDVAELHVYAEQKLEGVALTRSLVAKAQACGATLSPTIAAALVDRVGGDVWRLAHEVEKVAACAYGGTITIETIDKLVAPDAISNIFACVDAIAAQKADTALQLLADERAAGVADLYLLAMLGRQLRLLLQVSALVAEQQGIEKGTVAKALALHPFVAQKTMAQARRFSFAGLKRLHVLLARLDREVKRGRLDPTVAVDRLVAEMLL